MLPSPTTSEIRKAFLGFFAERGHRGAIEARHQLARNLGEGGQLAGIEPQPDRFDGPAAPRTQRLQRAACLESMKSKGVLPKTSAGLYPVMS